MALKQLVLSYGTFNSPSYSNSYILELIVTEEAINLQNNKSVISYELRLRSSVQNKFTDKPIGFSIVFDGSVVNSRSVTDSPLLSLDYSSTISLVYGQVEIEHDFDGTKTIPITYSISMESGSDVPGSLQAPTSTFTLTYIPRASSIRATDAYAGSSSLITLEVKDSSFTHVIRYRFNELTGYIDTNGDPTPTATQLSGKSIRFNIPRSFAAYIINKVADCTLECSTYYENTLVGEPTTTNFKIKIDEANVTPIVTISVKDLNSETVNLTGNDQVFVRYMSRALIEADYTLYQGASIVRAEIDEYSVDTNTKPLRLQKILSSDQVTALVIDSRGLVGVDTKKVSLIPYVYLTNNSTFTRSDPTSGDAVVEISGVCYNGDFGLKHNTLLATCTLENEITETIEIPIQDNNTYKHYLTISGLDYTREYNLTVTVEDCLMSVQKQLKLPKGVPVFDWGESDFQFNVPVTAPNYNGMYVHTLYVGDSTLVFRLKTKHDIFGPGAGNSRQTIWIFGSANTEPVYGMLTIKDNGESSWSGTGNVTASVRNIETGELTVRLPTGAYDYFTLMSAEYFNV